MALKDDINTIVKGLSSGPGFFFGTEKEFNTAADDLNFTNGMVFMYALQPVKNSATGNNSVNNTYSIFLAFLFKVETDTTTAQADVYDNQAINMINEFFVHLGRYKSPQGGNMFKINVKDKANSQQCYFNYNDLNLFGRSLSLDLKTFYNDKYCF